MAYGNSPTLGTAEWLPRCGPCQAALKRLRRGATDVLPLDTPLRLQSTSFGGSTRALPTAATSMSKSLLNVAVKIGVEPFTRKMRFSTVPGSVYCREVGAAHASRFALGTGLHDQPASPCPHHRYVAYTPWSRVHCRQVMATHAQASRRQQVAERLLPAT